MKLSTFFIISSYISIFCMAYFMGAYVQFEKDSEVINKYVENGSTMNPSCIPCECYTPQPDRQVTFTEPEPLIVGKMQRIPEPKGLNSTLPY